MKDSHIRTHEDRMKEAKSMNLLSNTFMSVTFKDIPACQYTLRKLTGIRDLVVKEVRTQYRVSKIMSHDAILDVLAEDSEGRIYNIEIQRADTVDHARRVRFYGAMVDSEFLEKGKDYFEMPEVYIIYISETDLWKQGKCLYSVNKILGNNEYLYEDGIHTVFVNAQIEDGSEIAALMHYFRTADPYDMSQGALSERVYFLKCEKEGEREMCEITDRWLQDGIEIGRKEGREEGIILGKIKIARKLARKGTSMEMIAEIVEEDVPIVQQWLEVTYA